MAQPLSSDKVLGKVCSKSYQSHSQKLTTKSESFKGFYLRHTIEALNPDDLIHSYNMNCTLNKKVQLVTQSNKNFYLT